MKKILYIVSTLKRSGPINQLSYIIKYLDKTKFEPIVLTLSSEPAKDSMKSYFTGVLGVRVYTLGLSRIKGVFLAKQKIQILIKKNNINLVHSQGIRADGFMSKIDIPRVATLRNYPFYDYLMTYGKIRGYIMAKIHLNYLRKIDESRVVSKSISKMLKDLNDYDIAFVRNGIDTQKFKNLNKKILRDKLKIDQHLKLFISVGHLSSRKDPLTIIKAFKNSSIKNSKLIFLGDGSLNEECKNAINSVKNIELIGRISNVEEYLGASDYFVSASLAEGLPNTVLEAMATGLPCILSNIPPHKEIYEINKKSSILFETKDINNLSYKMKEVIKKDYESMSESAKEISFKNLSAEIMSNNYQEIYTNLLF